MRKKLKRPIPAIFCDCNICCKKLGKTRIKLSNEALNGDRDLYKYLMGKFIAQTQDWTWNEAKSHVINILSNINYKKRELIRLMMALDT